MSTVQKIKDALTGALQKALGIDGIRFNLQVALERLERIHDIESKLVHLESRIASASTSDQIQNLKNFLSWYSNRVEPWFWTGNFSQTDPEEELAAFLLNFLPGAKLVGVGPKNEQFVEAAAASGYEVLWVEPSSSIASLAQSKSLPPSIGFLNVTDEGFDLEILKSLDWTKPDIVQTAFTDHALSAAGNSIANTASPDPIESISKMRAQEYYWNAIIFRTEAEGFIRMATNLASVPRQAWGTILFFKDHQLFLKAFHWCKTTLPRFRAAPLAVGRGSLSS
jgi:hypothetical protein